MNTEKIYDTLVSLGYKLDDRGVYWQTNALFRNGDNRTALQIYKDSGVWRDYVNNTPYLKLEALVSQTLGTEDENIISKYIDRDDKDALTTGHSKGEKLEMERVYEEDSLNQLLPHYDFYTKRGISKKVLSNLKGGLATKGQLYQRFVFPIYNKNLRIHGFSGRDMLNKNNRPKWKHLGRKSSWLYPLYMTNHKGKRIRDAIGESGELILVESIGDLLSCHENGYYNVAVTFGLDISPTLICEMVEINPSRIIIAFNNDTGKDSNRGLDGALKNYLKLLNHFDPHKLRICLPIKNDFGDMNTDDFTKWSNKLNHIDPMEHQRLVLEWTDLLYRNRKISKNLFKNRKFLGGDQ